MNRHTATNSNGNAIFSATTQATVATPVAAESRNPSTTMVLPSAPQSALYVFVMGSGSASVNIYTDDQRVTGHGRSFAGTSAQTTSPVQYQQRQSQQRSFGASGLTISPPESTIDTAQGIASVVGSSMSAVDSDDNSSTTKKSITKKSKTRTTRRR